MQLRWRRRATRFIQIFGGVTAATLITLLLAIVLTYRAFEGRLVDQMHEKSLQLLNQTRSVFSAIHTTDIPYYYQLTNDPGISTLMYGKDLTIRDLLRGVDSLDRAVLSRPYIRSTMVYNHRIQRMFITGRGEVPVEEFEDRMLLAVLNDVKEYGFYRYLPRRVENPATGELENIFTVIIGNTPVEGNQSLGAVIVNISEPQLRRSLLAGFDGIDPQVIIIDRDGLILSHPDPGLFGTRRSSPAIRAVLDRGEPTGMLSLTLDGNPYWVGYVSDREMGWRFISAAPGSDISGQIRSLRNRILLFALILMAVMLILDYILSRSLSRPIERLFSEAAGMQRSADKGEVSIDVDGSRAAEPTEPGEIEGLRSILLSARSRLDAAALVEFRASLRALLEGRVGEETIERENLPPYLRDESARVLAILVDRAFALRSRYGIEYLASVRRIVQSLAREIWNETFLAVEMESDQVVLIVPDEEETSLLSRLSRLQKQISRNLDAGISIGVGTGPAGIVRIRESYQAALTAVFERFRTGYGKVHFSDSVEAGEIGEYRFPDELVEQTADALLLGKSDLARERAGEIVRSTGEHRYSDFVLMLQLLSYSLRRTLRGRTGEEPQLGPDFERLSRDYRWVDTIEAATGLIDAGITFYLDTSVIDAGNRHEMLIAAAEEFVEGHLSDPGLCSAEIAEAVGLSTNYLLSLFKKSRRKSLSDHINCRRVDRAKELLEQRELSVKEVCEACGFSNYTYFFTIFKKKTGITPKQYHERG